LNSHRSLIFERIHGALSPVDKPESVRETPPDDATHPPSIPEQVVRQVPHASFEQLWERFHQRIEKLGDHSHRFQNAAAVLEWLLLEAKRKTFKQGIIDKDAAQYLSLQNPTDPLFRWVPSEDRQLFFQADFAITLVDFAVAETGSLGICSHPDRAPMSSLAPPIHFAVVPREALVADVFDGIEKQTNMDHSRSVVWITGSSRTADIDGILVHGAHGPRELHILMVG